MAKKTTTDQKTLELIKEVNRRKAEISKAEKPNWITNCSFSYTEGKADTINLHVENDVKKLILIVAFLMEKEQFYQIASKSLGVEAPSFTWGGHTCLDWLEDIRTRISKIQIASKKNKLEELESRLNAIISPELRTKLELEAITSELV